MNLQCVPGRPAPSLPPSGLEGPKGAVSAAVDRDRLVVKGAPEAAWVTKTLADAGIYLSELRAETKNLESVFLELTGTAPVPGQTVQIGESVAVPQAAVPVAAGEVTVQVESEGAER